MKSIYIFLAEGYEPLEALAPADVLKRAKLNVKFVSLTEERIVVSTQGYGLTADLTWKEFVKEKACSWNVRNCMIFPGGLPGADILGQSEELMDILREHYGNGGLVAAICAAPARVLARNIDVKGRKLTAYEGFENELEEAGAISIGEKVTIDEMPGKGTIITAKGPGVAIDFGLAILYHIMDPRIADVVKIAMMI